MPGELAAAGLASGTSTVFGWATARAVPPLCAHGCCWTLLPSAPALGSDSALRGCVPAFGGAFDAVTCGLICRVLFGLVPTWPVPPGSPVEPWLPNGL